MLLWLFYRAELTTFWVLSRERPTAERGVVLNPSGDDNLVAEHYRGHDGSLRLKFDRRRVCLLPRQPAHEPLELQGVSHDFQDHDQEGRHFVPPRPSGELTVRPDFVVKNVAGQAEDADPPKQRRAAEAAEHQQGGEPTATVDWHILDALGRLA